MYIVTSAEALTPLLIPCTSPVMSQHSVAYSSSSRIRGRRDLTHPQQNAMAYQAPQCVDYLPSIAHSCGERLNRYRLPVPPNTNLIDSANIPMHMSAPQLAIGKCHINQQTDPTLTSYRHHHQPVARPYNRRESREITSPDAYAYRGTGNHASILAPASARIPNLRPTPGITTFPCSWDGCGIPLDDDSRSGIKRHLEDFH